MSINGFFRTYSENYYLFYQYKQIFINVNLESTINHDLCHIIVRYATNKKNATREKFLGGVEKKRRAWNRFSFIKQRCLAVHNRRWVQRDSHVRPNPRSRVRSVARLPSYRLGHFINSDVSLAITNFTWLRAIPLPSSSPWTNRQNLPFWVNWEQQVSILRLGPRIETRNFPRRTRRESPAREVSNVIFPPLILRSIIYISVNADWSHINFLFF